MGTQAKLTFTDFLTHDDGSDQVHELHNGEVITMPPASPLHLAISRLLFRLFEQEIARLHQDLEVFTGDLGLRTQGSTCRQPDLCVISGKDWRNLLQEYPSSAILEKPAILVVEIVSPGVINRDRDYQLKVKEYQEIGVPEYWIIDPEEGRIRILNLDDRGNYQSVDYIRDQRIRSPLFPELDLTAHQAGVPFG